jgi:uncharacterized membrane protein YfcA
MEMLSFIDLSFTNVILLFLVGVVGGMVSGFIGSGGAFVLTPAMMTMGVPGIVAVASNICHKFPKALVGAIKRNKYGHVDVKLGVVMGLFAEFGMLCGKLVMSDVRKHYGDVGTSLYVSFIFVVVLAIVGGFVLRDARRMQKAGTAGEAHKVTRLAKWVQSVHIPGTMMHFKSLNASVSLLFVAPLGFATGMLAATIAVGGFIGVPAMMYVLGAPALMASATELVIAFVMGFGGTILYAWDGVVDVRLAMIILCGSLFGIQVGAVGTTYVKDYMVKLVMGVIMVMVLFSRFFYIPGYLSQLGLIETVPPETIRMLKWAGDATLVMALSVGAIIIVSALVKGIAEHKKRHEELAPVAGYEE